MNLDVCNHFWEQNAGIRSNRRAIEITQRAKILKVGYCSMVRGVHSKLVSLVETFDHNWTIFALPEWSLFLYFCKVNLHGVDKANWRGFSRKSRTKDTPECYIVITFSFARFNCTQRVHAGMVFMSSRIERYGIIFDHFKKVFPLFWSKDQLSEY